MITCQSENQTLRKSWNHLDSVFPTRTIEDLYNIMTWIKDRWPKCLIYNVKSCDYVFRGGTKGAGQVAPSYSTRLIPSSNYSRHEVCFSSTSQRHTSRWIGVYTAPRWVCECVCECAHGVLRMGFGSTATLTMNGCVLNEILRDLEGVGEENGEGEKGGGVFWGLGLPLLLIALPNH